jgi:predicted metalloprotease with PDZ domain
VHGTRELPLRELLQAHGIAVHDDPAQLAQRLGLRVAETGGAIQVKAVLRGGAAENAPAWPAATNGWAWKSAGEGWRLAKLDDLPLYAGQHKSVTALVARDRRLLRLPLTLPRRVTTWRLACVMPRRLRTVAGRTGLIASVLLVLAAHCTVLDWLAHASYRRRPCC